MPKFDLEDTHDNAVYMTRRAGFYGLWSSVGEALVTRTVREVLQYTAHHPYARSA